MRWFLVALSLVGCGASTPTERSLSEPPRTLLASGDAPIAEESEPLEVAEPSPEPRLEAGKFELPVAGFEPAVVVLPNTSEKVPLVIASHGAGGSPEWQCDHWARIVKERAIVLCPRGRRISSKYPGSYYYPDHYALEREFLAMLEAARARYGGRILEGAGIYTGFSQGATMGALMIVEYGRDFPFLILVEGATAEFSPRRARAYKESGGERVEYVCGGAWCAGRAERMVTTLKRAGLEASLSHVHGGGHTDDGRVGERAAQIFEALLPRALAHGRR